MASISTSMLGHVPISSLRLNVSLYLYSISITLNFSSLFKHDIPKSMYFSNISLSAMFLLSSSGSNHGYLSTGVVCSLSFNVSTNLLKYSQSLLASSNLYYMFKVCCNMPCFILYYPKDLMSPIPIISFRLRIMVSLPAFFMSKTALLCINFNFINSILLVLPSIILIIANAEISSTNRAPTFTSFLLIWL